MSTPLGHAIYFSYCRVLLFGFFFGFGLSGHPAEHGDTAGADQLEDAVGPHPLDEGLDLAFTPGDLDHQLAGADVDDFGPEDFDQLADLRALVAGRRLDLEQHQVALDMVAR